MLNLCPFFLKGKHCEKKKPLRFSFPCLKQDKQDTDGFACKYKSIQRS